MKAIIGTMVTNNSLSSKPILLLGCFILSFSKTFSLFPLSFLNPFYFGYASLKIQLKLNLSISHTLNQLFAACTASKSDLVIDIREEPNLVDLPNFTRRGVQCALIYI